MESFKAGKKFDSLLFPLVFIVVFLKMNFVGLLTLELLVDIDREDEIDCLYL